MRNIACLFLTLSLMFACQNTLWSAGSQDLVVNHIVAHPEIQSYIFVTDVEGKGPEVTVTFYTESGERLGEKRVVLNPNGNVVVEPFKVLGRSGVGTARIRATGGGVVAEYWQLVNRPESGEHYSVALPAQPATGHDYLVLQHFVSHPDIGSYLFLSDTQGYGPVVNILYLDEQGNRMKEERVLIPKNGTLVIDLFKKFGVFKIGTARLTSEGGPFVGEYWQIVNRKLSKEERERNPDYPEREQYAVAVPLRGKITTTLDVSETLYDIEFTTQVHFDFDKSEIRDVDKSALAEAARVITTYYKDKTVLIEGHTDESGEENYNLKLSQRRADSVRDYLVAVHGLDSSKLLAVGKGESEPLVPGAEGEAGYVNRRVVFVINK